MKCEICGEEASYLVNGQIGLCDDLDGCEVEELDYDDDEGE